MVAIEKKEQDKGEALLGDDTVVNVSYTVEARSLQEGLPPLHLATIKDFLRFIVASSRRTEKVIFDSMNAFAEWLFAGFSRVTGNRLDEGDRRAVFNVSV